MGSRSMQVLVEQFMDYLRLERALSPNTIAAYRSDLESFVTYLSAHRIRSMNHVRRQDILDFLLHEKDRGLNSTSLSRRLVAVKVFFRYLQQEGLLARNVTEVMDSPRLWKVLPAVLSYQEVENLLASADISTPLGIRNRAILETFYASGLRVSEIAELKLRDLHLEEGYLRCLGKGDKERVVPLGSNARDFLRRYLEFVRPSLARGSRDEHVFLTIRHRPFSRKGLWKMIKIHALRAGITKNVTPHTLRHSFASHLLAHGAPLHVIQEMLGHADIGTTEIYTHVDPLRLKTVHKKHHPRP